MVIIILMIQSIIFIEHFCENFLKTTLCEKYYFNFQFTDEEIEVFSKSVKLCFSDKVKLKKLIITKPLLYEMLKEIRGKLVNSGQGVSKSRIKKSGQGG